MFFRTHDVLFSMKGYRSGEPLTGGRKVVLGVRPEHIKVDEESGISELHEAVVDIEEPMGAEAQAANADTNADTDASADVAPGAGESADEGRAAYGT